MTNENKDSLNALIEHSIKSNWNLMALSDMGGVNLQYKDVALLIAKMHILFDAAGVKRGDKVAICGKNSSNWTVVFLSCLTAGVVAVPILHEFKPDTIHHLVNHSEAKLFFVDAAIWENLDERLLPNLVGAIYISEFGMPLSRSEKLTETRNNINQCFGAKYPYSFEPENVEYFADQPDDLAMINYTSGSTGMSKGVMVPFRSLWSNVRFCLDNLNMLKPGVKMVNMLPLAHMYGMTIEMLNPFCHGCHCYFLTKLPSPKIILKAFADVQPALIITVPLIVEKIIRNKVFPLLEKPLMKVLLKVPYLDDRLLAKIKENLLQAFGGNLKELIIGGAPLNADVEKFLYKIGFPITVGYGMTECGPLISYTPWRQFEVGSSGRTLPIMESMVLSDNPEEEPGEVCVKGVNVMMGYYRNPQATKLVLSDDGWLKTGDMGTRSADGTLFLRGRSKTMILTGSGQNIYPEEIEAKLNNMPYVAESLVVMRDGKLVGLVYPEYETLDRLGISGPELDAAIDNVRRELNNIVAPYERLSKIILMPNEFEKTPKRSIKRFLYQQ